MNKRPRFLRCMTVMFISEVFRSSSLPRPPKRGANAGYEHQNMFLRALWWFCFFSP